MAQAIEKPIISGVLRGVGEHASIHGGASLGAGMLAVLVIGLGMIGLLALSI